MNEEFYLVCRKTGSIGRNGILIEGRLYDPELGVMRLVAAAHSRPDDRRSLCAEHDGGGAIAAATFPATPRPGPPPAEYGLSALPSQCGIRSGAPGLNKVASNVINSNNV